MRTWLRTNGCAVAAALAFTFPWIAWYVFWALREQKEIASVEAFKSFHDEWGAILGIVLSIIVAAMAAAIPSRVESQVKLLGERIQQPLTSFAAIHGRALDLLRWVGDEPGSIFVMTSATPVFGIELDDVDRLDWENKLNARVVARGSGMQTELFCLDPDSNEGLGESPLWKFCTQMERSKVLPTPTVKTATDLFLRSMDALEKFAQLSAGQRTFALYAGAAPPIHFVYASKRNEATRCILYFTGVEANEGLVVSGFASEDERWIELAKAVRAHLSRSGSNPLAAHADDRRTADQRKRCMELLQHQLAHREPYEKVIRGFTIRVRPDVFPPDLGIGTDSLLDAIVIACGRMRAMHDGKRIVGIDVGTGTGILALGLRAGCDVVYASDTSIAAVNNAIENTSAKGVHVRQADLLSGLPPLGADDVPVLVFNHPFYASPLAVFNTKGRRIAGIPIIEAFLKQAIDVVRGRGVVLMPHSSIAEDVDPSRVARSLGFQVEELPEERRSGIVNRVYLFTRAS